MFSVAKACLPLFQHRQLVRYDLESECVSSNLPQIALIFARQVLKQERDIIGNDSVQPADSPIVYAMKGLDLERRINVYKTPAGFSIIQTFLLYILYHQSTYHIKYFLYNQAKKSQRIFGRNVGVRT